MDGHPVDVNTRAKHSFNTPCANANLPTSHAPKKRDLMETEYETAILQLDEWFRFAELIGQQRLYNFLMSASILLLACAAILSTTQGSKWFATSLSVFGQILSALWVIVGSRQCKFHEKIETEIDGILRKHACPKKFAITHVRSLKLSVQELSELGLQPDPNISLGWGEAKLSTRNFL